MKKVFINGYKISLFFFRILFNNKYLLKFINGNKSLLKLFFFNLIFNISFCLKNYSIFL